MTRYPTTLPAPPPHWWNFDIVERGPEQDYPDDGPVHAWVVLTVTAATPAEAELRVLAIADKTDDDLRGAYAEALCARDATWWVRLTTVHFE